MERIEDRVEILLLKVQLKMKNKKERQEYSRNLIDAKTKN